MDYKMRFAKNFYQLYMKYSLKYYLLFFAVLIAILTTIIVIKNNYDNKNIKDCLGDQIHCKLRIISSSKLREIFRNLNPSDEFLKPEGVSKIIVINLIGGLGDEFAARRMKHAAENLGWEAVIIGEVNNDLSLNAKIIQFLKPEFVISQHVFKMAKNVPNYLILHTAFKDVNKLSYKYFRYDGLLLSFGDDRFIKPLQYHYASNDKTLNYQYFYFSVSKKQSQFSELEYSKLFYSGARWDKRRGENYSKLYSLLDQAGYFNIYGPEDSWKDYPNSYKGMLPFDETIYLNAVKDSGVIFVVHSKDHYDNNLPSGRIFEALASSAVIISDDMKFVKDNFADNILYVDPSLPQEKLFLQIDNHMKWIKANPLKAREMARNANKIFQEKFVMESLLLNVEKMNNRIRSTK